MNRKILLSGLSIVSALTLMAGAAYAQLTTVATATGITFASENASLLIAKNVSNAIPAPGDFAQTQVFNTLHNVFPAYSQNFTFWLKNASGADIPLDNVVTLDTFVFTPLGNDLNTNLTVGFNCRDEGLAGEIDISLSSNGNFALSSWQPSGSEPLGILPVGHHAFCTMNAAVPGSVTSMANPESVSFTAKFTGTQVEPPASPTPSPTPL